MKKVFLFIIFLFVTVSILPQVGRDGKEEKENLYKETTIRDRAGGTHNASNIGLFFENRGKLYPRRITQGPSGEYPINSGKHYIYRINPFVGIPGNVIQGRYTENEEWEAVPGYQNPELSQIAFSDKPSTWHPENGWPVKDENGNPLILSDQDSYCAYDDANNTITPLGIQIDQVGYAYGVKFAQDILFFKYMITNKSGNVYNDLYFALYTDMDLGNVSGGVPEYEDDKIDFIKDKNFLYFYDNDGISAEWPDGKVGMIGVAFLKTPEVNGVQLGATDFHYNEYYDDFDIDTVQYGIMSSSLSLYNSSLYGPKYFHPGNSGSIHFDDPATLPPGGTDLLGYISSGPYTINPGDTLTFITAIIAGENRQQLFTSLDQAYKIVDFNFEISKPPAAPILYSYAGDGKVSLYWNDVAEKSFDNFSGEYDFEGYRLYKSLDKGINWELIADFDKANDLGLDKGLQYSYTDDQVVNGVEYWYSITSYDRGDESLESLESAKGSTTDAVNLVSAVPVSDAIGRIPVTAGGAEYSGTGISNYVLVPQPVDNESLSDNHYSIFFNYSTRTDRGKLKTQVTYSITDSSKTLPHHYGLVFKSARNFDIVDLTTGENIKEDNTYIPRGFPGVRYTAISGMEFRIYDPNPQAPADSLPSAGDRLTINFSINALKNNTEYVIKDRPFYLDKLQSTSDGVILKVQPPEIINDVSRVGGTDNFEITLSVENEAQVIPGTYLISVASSALNTSGNGIITVLVKNGSSETNFESLENLGSFTFNGIKCVVKFPPQSPPSPGNIYSVTTVLPVLPNVKDRYSFTINKSSISKETIKQELNKVRVVPNPYVVSSVYEPEFGELRREPLRQIQFINLPPECTIMIFTVDADLVKTIYHNSLNGTEVWDLRAEGGREIAPGMYVYVVRTDESEFIERFAVIK